METSEIKETSERIKYNTIIFIVLLCNLHFGWHIPLQAPLSLYVKYATKTNKRGGGQETMTTNMKNMYIFFSSWSIRAKWIFSFSICPLECCTKVFRLSTQSTVSNCDSFRRLYQGKWNFCLALVHLFLLLLEVAFCSKKFNIPLCKISRLSNPSNFRFHRKFLENSKTWEIPENVFSFSPFV